MIHKLFLFSFFFIVFSTGSLRAGFIIEAEIGNAFLGYDDVCAPRESGTAFSLQNDFHQNISPFIRLHIAWEVTKRHTFFGQAAPLRLDAFGAAPRPFSLLPPPEDTPGITFAQGEPVWIDMKMDTYRLGYLFTLVDIPKFIFKLGLSSRFRSGSIKARGVGKTMEVDNSNILPELCFSLNYFVGGGLGLFFESASCALLTSGYTHDLFAGIQYDINGRYFFRAGYRALFEKSEREALSAKTFVNLITLGAGFRL
jgi:hypothetical protein